MRYRRSISWILTLSAAAVLGSWASRAFLSMEKTSAHSAETIPVTEGAGRVDHLKHLARPEGAEIAAVHESRDDGEARDPSMIANGLEEVIPDYDSRLQEQINTLRLGSITTHVRANPNEAAVVDAEATPVAPVRVSADQPRISTDHGSHGPAAARLGWAVLIGGAFMVAVPAAFLLLRGRSKAVPVRQQVAAAGVQSAESPVPRAEFDVSMRRVQESILEMIQLVEAIHQRIEEMPSRAVPEAGMTEQQVPESLEQAGDTEQAGYTEQAEDPNARGPWADRDLSLPTPETADGRDLTAIRRAVLRLSEQGWRGESIAERLRLGRGDVGLILKSGGSGAKAGRRMESGVGRN